ncbi:MAG: hypothetical protein JWQ17_1225 [Tardiphaga sp.]|jgi:hypothetical protein|nr:hypothetical protein [Tardiphaga sp.]
MKLDPKRHHHNFGPDLNGLDELEAEVNSVVSCARAMEIRDMGP